MFLAKSLTCWYSSIADLELSFKILMLDRFVFLACAEHEDMSHVCRVAPGSRVSLGMRACDDISDLVDMMDGARGCMTAVHDQIGILERHISWQR